MFSYNPDRDFPVCTNPYMLFYSILFAYSSKFGHTLRPVGRRLYRPDTTQTLLDLTGEVGCIWGVKHNVLPLSKLLGMDLIYELTLYTRLQMCKYLDARRAFIEKYLQLLYTKQFRTKFLIDQFRIRCSPKLIIEWPSSPFYAIRPIVYYNVFPHPGKNRPYFGPTDTTLPGWKAFHRLFSANNDSWPPKPSPKNNKCTNSSYSQMVAFGLGLILTGLFIFLMMKYNGFSLMGGTL